MGTKRFLKAVSLLVCIVALSGCNVFESFDRSIEKRDSSTLVEHGNYKLASANYAEALDLFERASEGGFDDDVRRGLGASYAGLAGFNMFSFLDSLQNSVTDPNSSAVIFFASAQISDLDLLIKAVENMELINNPGNDDYLLRSLMAVCASAKIIYKKYDTYTNNKLDSSDQIALSVNDGEVGTWEDLYYRFSSKNDKISLEKAYLELAKALSGRGASRTTMSPFDNVIETALFTEANFKTVAAVEKFANTLKLANIAYNSSDEASFKAYIMSLDDGAVKK